MNNARFGFEYLKYEQMPKHSVRNLATEAGLSEKDIKTLAENGLSLIPCCEGDPIIYLKKLLIELAKHKTGINIRSKLVLFLHSIPGMALQSPSFIDNIMSDTPFNHIPIISISGQPCSVFHYGIQLAEHSLRWMEKNAVIILIGMDIATQAKDRFFFGSAMGDSILIGCVSSLNVEHEILGNYTDTCVIATNGEGSPSDMIAKFRAANPSFIRQATENCLNKANLDLTNVDWIVPHTPYNKISQIIGEMLGFPNDQIIMNYLGETGHLNSNDSFCHYIRACTDGNITNRETALLINPGFGGTRGITILKKRE